VYSVGEVRLRVARNIRQDSEALTQEVQILADYALTPSELEPRGKSGTIFS
jgi:hypothetical protein